MANPFEAPRKKPVTKNQENQELDRDAIWEKKRREKFNYKEFPLEKAESLSRQTSIPVDDIQAAASLFLSTESPVLDVDSLDEVEKILIALGSYEPASENGDISGKKLLESVIRTSNYYHQSLLSNIVRRVGLRNDGLWDRCMPNEKWKKGDPIYFNQIHNGVQHLSPRVYNMFAHISKTKIDELTEKNPLDAHLEDFLKKIRNGHAWYEIGLIKEELGGASSATYEDNRKNIPHSEMTDLYAGMMNLGNQVSKIMRETKYGGK